MFASYRKAGSLNPYPVTNLGPELELMYLLRKRRTLSSQKSSSDARALNLVRPVHSEWLFYTNIRIEDYYVT